MNAEFVYGAWAEILGIGNIRHLRSSESVGRESGEARRSVWIGLREVVEEVIPGDQAEATVIVQPETAFIPAQAFIRRRRRVVGAVVGQWNVLHQVLRGRRNHRLGNYGVRKNAIRVQRAAWFVIRFSLRYAVAELLGELLRPISPGHHSRQLTGHVGEIALTVGSRRNRNEAAALPDNLAR